MAIGLYIHIPFCLKKCAYCDFCSFPAVDPETRAGYLSSLCDEIRSYRTEPEEEIDTVFFGGGTPSLLTPDELRGIFCAIRESFRIADGAEITIESNPKTLTREKLRFYREIGINRLSIGLQSADPAELRLLGRVHDFEDFRSGFLLAREAGFSQINVDLIYAVPGQSKESFLRTLAKVTALSPEHISCYSLILEEGTPLYAQKDALVFPTEDEEYEIYLAAVAFLKEKGYRHYEISNYALPGSECRHNLHYWRDEEYIGVGMAAHSYYRGKRYGNVETFAGYADRFGSASRKAEDSLGREDAFEYAMLRLRLSEGMSLSEYEATFGREFAAGKRDRLRFYQEGGYLILRDGRLAMTDRGFYVSNAILSDLL